MGNLNLIWDENEIILLPVTRIIILNFIILTELNQYQLMTDKKKIGEKSFHEKKFSYQSGQV
jgi:hypothetical protein